MASVASVAMLLGLVCAALVAHHPLRSSVSHEMRELVMEQQEEETPQPEGTQGRIDESASRAASALRESLDGTPDDAVLLQDDSGPSHPKCLRCWQYANHCHNHNDAVCAKIGTGSGCSICFRHGSQGLSLIQKSGKKVHSAKAKKASPPKKAQKKSSPPHKKTKKGPTKGGHIGAEGGEKFPHSAQNFLPKVKKAEDAAAHKQDPTIASEGQIVAHTQAVPRGEKAQWHKAENTYKELYWAAHHHNRKGQRRSKHGHK